jgi:hypothetical protein
VVSRSSFSTASSHSTTHIRNHHASASPVRIAYFVVQTFVEFSEMSEWLGQRYEDILKQSPGLEQLYHPFDAISRALLFRQLDPLGDQRFRPRNVVLARAHNPRFYFVHARIAGTKPRFLTKKGHRKRGFRALVLAIVELSEQ